MACAHVVGVAAVAAGHVEVAVRTEAQPAAVVVGGGLGEREQGGERSRVGLVGLVGSDPQLGDHGHGSLARKLAGLGEAHEEAPVAREVGVEGKAQQPTLPGGLEARESQEGRGANLSRDDVQDADARLIAGALLDDEQAPAIGGRRDGEQGSREARGHQLARHLSIRRPDEYAAEAQGDACEPPASPVARAIHDAGEPPGSPAGEPTPLCIPPRRGGR